MSFLAPLFLLGGLAIALPVIFHLVRRSSREKLVFSSLMFLKPTPPRMTRRNRLEHIFLLLLRCLVVGLLAFAFARPFLQKPMAATPTAGAGSQIVLLVDTSASMKREGAWPAALEKAEAALKQASPVDEVAVLTFDDRVRTVVSFEQWAGLAPPDRASVAAQRLAENPPAWHSTHLGYAFITAAETIEDTEKHAQHSGPKRIVLISDLQEGSRLDGLQGREWPRGLEVVIQPVKAKRPTNAGLQWVMDTDESSRTMPDAVRIRVSNSADAQREQFQLRWIGLAGSNSMDAYVPPGQSRIVVAPALPTNVPAAGISLSGDDEDFDNTTYVVQPKAEESDVLYLGSDSKTDSSQLLYYLDRAFQDTRRQAVRLSNASGDLSTNRLVIVSSNLPEAQTASVRQFLVNGGTVLMVMSDPQIAVTLSQLVGAPDLNAAEATVANYAMFGQVDFNHPLFAPFADPRFGDFTKIRFWKHCKLAWDKLPGARLVASYDDQDPAILEIPVGRGRVFAFTFSWKPEDSQFALSSKFVPLLYSLLDQSGSASVPPAQFRVGETVDLSAIVRQSRGSDGRTSPQSGGNISVRKPDASVVQLTSWEARFTQTDQPGIYEVPGPTPTKFAVNLDGSESKTVPMSTDELERLGLPMRPTELSPAVQAAQAAKLHNAEIEARQKLWRWLIVAALAVLLVETWLAGWITRRSVVSVEAAT